MTPRTVRRGAAGGPALVANIDGGARGNPGPAGYGAHVVADPGGETVAEIYGFLGTTTNNIAEYAALLALLEHVAGLQPRSLLIRSDSELLVRQINGQYRVKDSGLKVLHGEARRLMAALPHVTIEHVRREQNREADALANRAMDSRQSSGSLPAALRDLPRVPSQTSLS